MDKQRPAPSLVYATARQLEENGLWTRALSGPDHAALRGALASEDAWRRWFQPTSKISQEETALRLRVRSELYEQMTALLFASSRTPSVLPGVMAHLAADTREAPVAAGSGARKRKLEDLEEEDYDALDDEDAVVGRRAAAAPAPPPPQGARLDASGALARGEWELGDMYYTLEHDLADYHRGMAAARESGGALQPPRVWAVQDEENREKLFTAVDNAINAMKKYDFAEPFLVKVPKKEAPDYYEIIKHPMDLGTMQAKLKRGDYNSKGEVLRDAQLVFDNCREYNTDPACPILDSLHALEEHLLPLLEAVPEVVLLTPEEKAQRRKADARVVQLRALEPEDTVEETDPKVAAWKESTRVVRAQRLASLAAQSHLPFDEADAFVRTPANMATPGTGDVQMFPELHAGTVLPDLPPPRNQPVAWDMPPLPRNDVTRNIERLTQCRKIRNLIIEEMQRNRAEDAPPVEQQASVLLPPLLPPVDASAPVTRSSTPVGVAPAVVAPGAAVAERAVATVAAGERPAGARGVLRDTGLLNQLLEQSLVLLLAHAGFEGVQAGALEILVDVTRNYLSRTGGVLRQYRDTLGRVHPEKDLVARSLNEMNVTPHQLLAHHRNDIVGYGSKLQQLQERLAARWDTVFANPDALDDMDISESSFMSGWLDGYFLDILGLGTYGDGVARHIFMAIAGTQRGEKSAVASAPTEKVKGPIIRFNPPPPFPVIKPDEQITCLRDLMRRKGAEGGGADRAAAAGTAYTVPTRMDVVEQGGANGAAQRMDEEDEGFAGSPNKKKAPPDKKGKDDGKKKRKETVTTPEKGGKKGGTKAEDSVGKRGRR